MRRAATGALLALLMTGCLLELSPRPGTGQVRRAPLLVTMDAGTDAGAELDAGLDGGGED